MDQLEKEFTELTNWRISVWDKLHAGMDKYFKKVYVSDERKICEINSLCFLIDYMYQKSYMTLREKSYLLAMLQAQAVHSGQSVDSYMWPKGEAAIRRAFIREQIERLTNKIQNNV